MMILNYEAVWRNNVNIIYTILNIVVKSFDPAFINIHFRNMLTC